MNITFPEIPATATKKLKLKLVGINGNAFSLMGAFQRQARKEKWTEAEIKLVLNDAMSGDYSHLLNVLGSHCINDGF